MARGRFLSAATSRYPAVVLGADAASALGIDRADGSVRVWLGNRWFGVIGILDRLPLPPELDRTALIGFPVGEQLLRASGRLRSTCGPRLLPSRRYRVFFPRAPIPPRPRTRRSATRPTP